MVKKISFCIPTIHDYPSIYHTINNIQTEMLDSPYGWEIIVVENGTVDPNTSHAFTGAKPLYRSFMRTGRLKYFFEKNQCGPSARNTGARNASGDFVLFMDSHTNLGKNTVEPLADYLIDHPKCGCISGLTSWSHYDKLRLGAYYELFHPKTKQESGKGGPTLCSHMHGHYMALGRVPAPKRDKPFEAVMGSQAYTMYRLREFLDIKGYFSACRFYPHPEGYMPLKMWMTGKTVVVHPDSWHIHGMFPRHYSLSGEETMRKINEYGGYSWHWHGMRNVLMIAYILGDEKWLNICYDTLMRKHNPPKMGELKESAIRTVDETGTREWLRDRQEISLDETLIYARKNKIMGMEKWYQKIGRDPL